MDTGIYDDVVAPSGSPRHEQPAQPPSRQRRARTQDGTFRVDPSINWSHAALRTRRGPNTLFNRFVSEDVEKDFIRFAYLKDPRISALACTGIGLAYIVTAVTSAFGPSNQMSPDAPPVVVFFVTSTVFFLGALVSLCIGFLHSVRYYGRGIAGDHRMVTLYRHLQFGLWAVVGVSTFGVLSYTSRPCFSSDPRFATSDMLCHRAFRSGPEAVLAATALFVREPKKSIFLLIFNVLLQAVIFARPTSFSLSAFAFAFVVSVVTALCCAFCAAWRDCVTRNHFTAIAAVVASQHEVTLQRQELALIVQYAVPEGLLHRVLESVSTSPTLLSESSERCLVALTSAAALGRRATAQLLRVKISQLHDTFTAFDAAARAFGVEKATVYGDVYAVSSGMSGEPSLAAITRFVQWQVTRDVNIDVRSVITLGSATGSLIGEGALAYVFRGRAVEIARETLRAVPDKHVWISDEALKLPVLPKLTTEVVPGQPHFRDWLFSPSPPQVPSLHSSSLSIDADRFWEIANQPASRNPLSADSDDSDIASTAMTTTTQARSAQLKKPEAVYVSAVRPWWGTFTLVTDEAAYCEQAARDIILAAPYVFAFGSFLTTSILVIAAVERWLDPHVAYATSPAVDAAFFVLNGIASVGMTLLGPIHILMSYAERNCVRSTATTRAVGLPHLSPRPFSSKEGGAERMRRQQGPVDLASMHFPTALVMSSVPRLTVAWLSLVMVVMCSLMALQRSVITDGPHFLFLYGIATSAVVLRGQPWGFSALGGFAVCILPLIVLSWYHMGPAITPIVGVLIRGGFILLAARGGPQAAREEFAALQQARACLDAVSENAETIRKILQRQMPPHVSQRGVAALRAAITDTPSSLESTMIVVKSNVTVADFFADFACVTLRVLPAVRPSTHHGLHDDRVAERVEAAITTLTDSSGLYFLQSLGDEVMIGGPFNDAGPKLNSAVASCLAVLTMLAEQLPHRGFVAAGSVEEAMGAIVGARSVRYRLYGVAVQHSQALLCAGVSCVIEPPSQLIRLLVCTRRFHRVLHDAENVTSLVSPGGSSFKQIWRLREVGVTEVHGRVL